MKTIIVTCAIQLTDKDFSYLEKSKELIKTYLTHTNFDILILTNNVDFYQEENKRVKIYEFNESYGEPIKSGGKFNMHIKRIPIEIASDLDYDIVYHHDCDCFIDGWDEESYAKTVKKDFDVFFPKDARPQLGGLIKNYKRFKDKIEKEFKGIFYEELNKSPNPAETRIIFKNNKKLKAFLDFWKKISKNNKDYLTYFCGVYFGTSAKDADMNMSGVNYNDKFTSYGRIYHGNKILDYFGTEIK